MRQTSDDLLYFPVNTLRFDSLFNWKENNKHVANSNITSCIISCGTTVTASKHDKRPSNLVLVNGTWLALLRYGDDVYAVQSECPHAGGPMHLADIEEIPTYFKYQKRLQITCPWHKWKFNLKTGKLLFPPNRSECLETYPVKVDPNSGIIRIGFLAFAPSLFVSEDF